MYYFGALPDASCCHGEVALCRMPEDLMLRHEPLRILFVSPGSPTGPPLIFVHREAEALRVGGHQVDVFGFDNGSYLPWHIAHQVWKLRGEIRRLRPDVVHAQFGKFNALVAALSLLSIRPNARMPAKPIFVITFRGTDINRNTRYSALRSALGVAASQIAAFASQGLICVSNEIRDKVWARKSRLSIVVPTGVDLRTFVVLERDAARERLGLGLQEKIILFHAGSNPPVKDPLLAGAAVAEAGKHVTNLRFLVLDGTAQPDQIPLYMNAADCLLVTSYTEGSPAVVQEAMACNLPVVSVDVGDVRERLADVAGCAVLSRRDPHALGEALAAVLRRLGRSDGRYHATNLAVGVIAARLTAHYWTLLAKERHGNFHTNVM
jgi:teichuronic acid biosynthesis glycosyltransferase TuaC